MIKDSNLQLKNVQSIQVVTADKCIMVLFKHVKINYFFVI